MDLQLLLDTKKISKHHLSKISGVPNTTILDICSGRSSIEKCNAKTVLLLARALGCTMEDIMSLDSPNEYSRNTGLPIDKSYFECGLPQYLQTSLDNMKKSWKIIDSGKNDLHWDLYWCELNADINSAEVDHIISSEQAWYLREKYLRMERD
ncbi:helix-turn-helix domain-containing protein [Massiliimalia massiliensis]|uniref:helix-turn-helix domain-containing protein n=1 Tax=Massiliimalia massiliensis TaxID=1852384 RepID=UPI00098748B3|nr:helix-turn-helix transcriptional regulator [Massiliimalia massiliensis]